MVNDLFCTLLFLFFSKVDDSKSGGPSFESSRMNLLQKKWAGAVGQRTFPIRFSSITTTFCPSSMSMAC